jgi:hypothetical protein
LLIASSLSASSARSSGEDIADEAERLLAFGKGIRNAAKEGHDDGEQENDQEVERDETDPYNEVIFGRRRPDSVVIDWANKVFMCWNSSVRRINDVITEIWENLEQLPNTERVVYWYSIQ